MKYDGRRAEPPYLTPTEESQRQEIQRLAAALTRAEGLAGALAGLLSAFPERQEVDEDEMSHEDFANVLATARTADAAWRARDDA